jgi:uncharacterized protein (DUF1330 family)
LKKVKFFTVFQSTGEAKLTEERTNSSKANIVVSFEDDQKVLKCLAEQKYFSSESSEKIVTVHCKKAHSWIFLVCGIEILNYICS